MEILADLKKAQSQIKGLFRITLFKSNEYLPVFKIEHDKVTCIKVHTLLGASKYVIHITEGHYIAFPNGKSMKEMIDNDEFMDWYKKEVVERTVTVDC